MTSQQYQQLWEKFDGMNNNQKKEFIDKFKIKTQNSNNAEYTKFLNDCVREYNALVGTRVCRQKKYDIMEKTFQG